ncbi:MAG TPA: AlkA N-terminal domain-containing protein [Chthoniobacterales bacterium]|jgi:AraC family transcriptional regulator of adaptative response / DNA-3-methyladenine glycosylase II|nr:AlkA N-terminal domain-containing protein [Chthoniobacterales bacterium]
MEHFLYMELNREQCYPAVTAPDAQRAAEVNSCFSRLSYRPPFEWESLLAFLTRRVFARVEQVDGVRYRRTVEIGMHRGWICVENESARASLCVEVSVSLMPVLTQVLVRLRRLFDLDAIPEEISSRLGSLAEAHPGLRVPGAFDGFEMAVRAILGQQISVKAAATLAARLTERFADSIVTPFPALSRLGPRASVVSEIPAGQLAAIGLTRSRARSILALAHAVATGAISFDPTAPVDRVMMKLKELPGIGEWTTQYIAMRALRWSDAFPESDLGILKALRTKTPSHAASLAERWRPWRAYAAMHLWKTLTEIP